VTASNGYPLPTGITEFPVKGNHVYGVTSTGAATVAVLGMSV